MYGLQKGENLKLAYNQSDLWKTLTKFYNVDAQVKGWQVLSENFDTDHKSQVECKIAGFYESTNGKYSKDQDRQPDDQIIIEVNTYLDLLAPGAPQSLREVSTFREWLLEEGRSTEFVQLLVMTLPSPRYEYYQSANYDQIQLDVLSYSNEIIQAFGLYPVQAKLELLKEMKLYQF